MKIIEPLVDYAASTTVGEAIRSRRSLRAFLPDAVPRDTLETLLATAARAPSGTNLQPWNTLVVQGDTQRKLCEAVCRSFDDPDNNPSGEVPYYPNEWFSPYIERRRKVGWDLYGLLGIGKKDRVAMHAQHRRNFLFFDAPVGLIFTIHKDLSTGSWLDYGMYLQNIMLLAREQGLHTCPQAAWSDHHEAIRAVLPIPDDHYIVCGMALGYADGDDKVNTLETERESIDNTVQFLD